MLKTAAIAAAGGFVSVPVSSTLAFMAAVVAIAALVAHERRMARDF